MMCAEPLQLRAGSEEPFATPTTDRQQRSTTRRVVDIQNDVNDEQTEVDIAVNITKFFAYEIL